MPFTFKRHISCIISFRYVFKKPSSSYSAKLVRQRLQPIIHQIYKQNKIIKKSFAYSWLLCYPLQVLYRIVLMLGECIEQHVEYFVFVFAHFLWLVFFVISLEIVVGELNGQMSATALSLVLHGG
jgi:hypothetical protein